VSCWVSARQYFLKSYTKCTHIQLDGFCCGWAATLLCQVVRVQKCYIDKAFKTFVFAKYYHYNGILISAQSHAKPHSVCTLDRFVATVMKWYFFFTVQKRSFKTLLCPVAVGVIRFRCDKGHPKGTSSTAVVHSFLHIIHTHPLFWCYMIPIPSPHTSLAISIYSFQGYFYEETFNLKWSFLFLLHCSRIAKSKVERKVALNLQTVLNISGWKCGLFYMGFSLFNLPCNWLVGRFGRNG